MIALQVRKLAPSTKISKQDLVDYINDCTLISSYVYGFTNASLSSLQDPPVWFSSFVQQFGIAKGHAMQWNDSIVSQLLGVPQNLCDMNTLVQTKFRHIGDLLHDLQANPQDGDIKQEIIKQLDNIHGRIVAEIDTCTQLLQSIQQFDDYTSNDYAVLKQGLDECLHQLEVDEAEMTRLKNEIETLKRDIQACSDKVTAAEVGGGLSIFICVVGIVIGASTAGAGATLVGIGVSGLSASIGTVIAMKQEIHEDQNKIKQDTAHLNTLSNDVIALSANTEILQQVCTANQAAQEALKKVISLWTEFAVNLKALRTELEVMENDLSSQDINGAISELAQIQNDWNELDSFAGQLVDVNYQYSSTVNKIGS